MKRFFDKVRKDSDCWIWTASNKGKTGYGAFKFNGKTIDAHRMSWIIHNGNIPDGLYVCHKCDVRLCVNPSHLFLGTHRDNMIDAMKKGRLFIPTNGNKYVKGNISHKRLLSENDAIKVKIAIKNKGNKKLIELARELNVKYRTLIDIKTGRSYHNINIPNETPNDPQ